LFLLILSSLGQAPNARVLFGEANTCLTRDLKRGAGLGQTRIFANMTVLAEAGRHPLQVFAAKMLLKSKDIMCLRSGVDLIRYPGGTKQLPNPNAVSETIQ